MARTKKDKPEKVEEKQDEQPVEAEIKAQKDVEAAAPPQEVEKKKTYFDVLMWKGVKEVYRCAECGRQHDHKDDLILHIINHYPPDKRMAVMNELLKE